MKHQETRGVSLGTILMLTLTLVVLGGCAFVLPKLMGTADTHIADLAMLTSVNLSDLLPAREMSDIPINHATESPAATPEATMPVRSVIEATDDQAVTPTPVPQTTPVPVGGTVNLTFGGSIVIDDKIRKSGNTESGGYQDYTRHLSLIADELDSDMTLVTLEALTDPQGSERQLPNAPMAVMDMLSAANIDMVALGFNKAGERGLAGIKATISNAEDRGLQTLGAYGTPQDAQTLKIVSVNNVQIGYLHYAGNVTGATREELSADGADFAVPTFSFDKSAGRISEDIVRMREGGAEIVIVCLNWGGFSIDIEKEEMIDFVQALADAGADVIVGSGTKAVRGITEFRGKREDGTLRKNQTLCIWSLGSLLNGGRNDGNVASMLVHLQLSYNGNAVSFERVTYTPTYIWTYMDDGVDRYQVIASDQPSPVDMSSKQAKFAEKHCDVIRKLLNDSPASLRTK